jgi:hypothetical protein
MVLLKLLQTWGLKGFLEHAEKTALFYRERRDVLAAHLERHLRSDPQDGGATLAEWKVPDASMFFWVKLNLKSSSLRSEFDAEASPAVHETGAGNKETQAVEREEDSTPFIRDIAVPRGVLVLPGKTAFPDGRETLHVRLSFSLLSDEEMGEAVKRLAGAIVEQQQRPRRVLVDPSHHQAELVVGQDHKQQLVEEEEEKDKSKTKTRTTTIMIDAVESEKPLPSLPRNVSSVPRSVNPFRRVASFASFSIFAKTTSSSPSSLSPSSASQSKPTLKVKTSLTNFNSSIKRRTSRLTTRLSMSSFLPSGNGSLRQKDAHHKLPAYRDDSQETTQIGTSSDEAEGVSSGASLSTSASSK